MSLVTLWKLEIQFFSFNTVYLQNGGGYDFRQMTSLSTGLYAKCRYVIKFTVITPAML